MNKLGLKCLFEMFEMCEASSENTHGKYDSGVKHLKHKGGAALAIIYAPLSICI